MSDGCSLPDVTHTAARFVDAPVESQGTTDGPVSILAIPTLGNRRLAPFFLQPNRL